MLIVFIFNFQQKFDFTIRLKFYIHQYQIAFVAAMMGEPGITMQNDSNGLIPEGKYPTTGDYIAEWTLTDLTNKDSLML